MGLGKGGGFPGHGFGELARSEAGIKNGSVKGVVINALLSRVTLPHDPADTGSVRGNLLAPSAGRRLLSGSGASHAMPGQR